MKNEDLELRIDIFDEHASIAWALMRLLYNLRDFTETQERSRSPFHLPQFARRQLEACRGERKDRQLIDPVSSAICWVLAGLRTGAAVARPRCNEKVFSNV